MHEIFQLISGELENMKTQIYLSAFSKYLNGNKKLDSIKGTLDFKERHFFNQENA